MAGSCIALPTITGAITLPQFREALRRTWREPSRFVTGRGATTGFPRNLGLAVSGGVDSMALAYLSKQLETHDHSEDRVSVTAFVVDHKAREESSQEANIVAQWLIQMGIKTQVLELEWPNAPSSMSAFETHARRLRFQALGKASRDHQIEALLMGHHRDDNVETTLWRLCSGARGAGLAGIPPVARIPECHGLYGVSGSGCTTVLSPDKFLEPQPQSRKFNHSHNPETRNHPCGEHGGHQEAPIAISSGGILIARPLLSFPKTSLMATCHDNNIPFVSDPTNFDLTLTPRNTIRNLLTSNKLPRALQTPSILSLVQSSHNLLRDSVDISDKLLKQCRILNFTFTTGTMKIQFPPSLQPLNCGKGSKDRDNIPGQRLHQIQSLTLRRITELISPFPENHFSLRKFQESTHRVFPSPEQPTATSFSKRTPFTLGGVMFQPQPISPPSSPENSAVKNNNSNNNNNNNTWFLSRQPFMRHRLPTLSFAAPITDTLRKELSSLEFTPKEEERPVYTPWSLWDNRYWFRFAVVTARRTEDSFFCHKPKQLATSVSMGENDQISLVVRPLQPSDFQWLRGNQGRLSRRLNSLKLAALLDQLERDAPGQSRFTVPLLCIDKISMRTDKDLPVALPTLSLWLPELPGAQEEYLASTPWTIIWEWKYKMLDTKLLELMT